MNYRDAYNSSREGNHSTEIFPSVVYAPSLLILWFKKENIVFPFHSPHAVLTSQKTKNGIFVLLLNIM